MYKLFLILSLVYAFEETNVQWTFLSCIALEAVVLNVCKFY